MPQRRAICLPVLLCVLYTATASGEPTLTMTNEWASLLAEVREDVWEDVVESHYQEGPSVDLTIPLYILTARASAGPWMGGYPNMILGGRVWTDRNWEGTPPDYDDYRHVGNAEVHGVWVVRTGDMDVNCWLYANRYDIQDAGISAFRWDSDTDSWTDFVSVSAQHEWAGVLPANETFKIVGFAETYSDNSAEFMMLADATLVLDPNRTHVPDPIPEPSGILLMSLGVMFQMISARRRRRG